MEKGNKGRRGRRGEKGRGRKVGCKEGEFEVIRWCGGERGRHHCADLWTWNLLW